MDDREGGFSPKAFGLEGAHDIVLLVAAAGNKSGGLVQALRFKNMSFDGVSVKDRYPGVLVGDLLGDFEVGFEESDRKTSAVNVVENPFRDGACTDDGDIVVLDFLVLK